MTEGYLRPNVAKSTWVFPSFCATASAADISGDWGGWYRETRWGAALGVLLVWGPLLESEHDNSTESCSCQIQLHLDPRQTLVSKLCADVAQVLPAIADMLAPESQLIVLVKPQFEAGKSQARRCPISFYA